MDSFFKTISLVIILLLTLYISKTLGLEKLTILGVTIYLIVTPFAKTAKEENKLTELYFYEKPIDGKFVKILKYHEKIKSFALIPLSQVQSVGIEKDDDERIYICDYRR